MRDDRLIKGSMGSYLTPPYHPSKFYEVETDIRRKKENRGGCNIEHALEQAYISDETKNKIQQLLKNWEANEKMPIDSAEVQKWISDCKNHMGNRAAEYIRKYYPEFKNLVTTL